MHSQPLSGQSAAFVHCLVQKPRTTPSLPLKRRHLPSAHSSALVQSSPSFLLPPPPELPELPELEEEEEEDDDAEGDEGSAGDDESADEEGADPTICAWPGCKKPRRPNSKYCSRACSNKNARSRHKQRGRRTTRKSDPA